MKTIILLLALSLGNVELINGTVLNDNNDGLTADGYYINYSSADTAAAGDEVTTLLINNLFNDAPDDIIIRLDVVR